MHYGDFSKQGNKTKDVHYWDFSKQSTKTKVFPTWFKQGYILCD